MNWDLYVDESGDFEKGKRCLVGGFIVPEGSVNPDLLLQWKEQIMAIPEISAKMEDVRWDYDHCMRNRFTTKRKQIIRSEIQYSVVEEYKKRIAALGGKIIIFDNPSGIYNTDNTTNFLTILAKGLMALYYDWPEKDPVIQLHFASRKNMTYKFEPEALAISPTRVMEPGQQDDVVILTSQYKAIIRSLAFLQSGQYLLENNNFSNMLDNIDILKDEFERDENGKILQQTAHPLTVPCDYICNTLIKADSYDAAYQKRIKTLYRQPDAIIYYTDRPLAHAPNELPNWQNNENNGRVFMRLISHNFPEPTTSRFMNAFNTSSINEQKTCMAYIIRQLYSKVEGQEIMDQLAERLDTAIDITGQIDNEQIRYELIANLLLYQESLFTHLGNQKKVSVIRHQFEQTIDRIKDDSAKDELINISDNRRLVDLTDMFDYDSATQLFESIEQYWKETIRIRKTRQRSNTEDPKYPTYGKTIGSYLQVLRHEIHQADPDDKELYYSEATDRFRQARDNLIEAIDKSRFHQTACDIEAEMGHEQEAFNHLWMAANIEKVKSDEIKEDIPITAKTADEILKESGYGGELYPYLLQHYVRTLSLMYMADPENKKAETILQPLIGHINDQLGDAIRAPHPRIQIQWKTASMLAARKASNDRQRQLAARLYSKAVETLKKENQTVFLAIATGILAEEAWHIEEKHIPGDAKSLLAQMKQLYQYYITGLPLDKKDPFDKAFMRLEPEEMLKEKDKLLQMSYLIGY